MSTNKLIQHNRRLVCGQIVETVSLSEQEILQGFYDYAENSSTGPSNYAKSVLNGQGYKRWKAQGVPQKKLFGKFVEYVDTSGRNYFCYKLPNGGHRSNIDKLEAAGLIKGVWDLSNETYHGKVVQKLRRRIVKPRAGLAKRTHVYSYLPANNQFNAA